MPQNIFNFIKKQNKAMTASCGKVKFVIIKTGTDLNILETAVLDKKAVGSPGSKN